MVAKNRPAFLELEPEGVTAYELWRITGFVRCVDCGFLIHTETLIALPEHRCIQRQARRQANQPEAGMTIQSSEQKAAATLASECTDRTSVILWCADRVQAADEDPTVQDAADYLRNLSGRVQVDATSVSDRVAVIRWCAMQIHSMGGDYAVERAAEYLDDLATEAEGSA